jgi:hypothetical protein
MHRRNERYTNDLLCRKPEEFVVYAKRQQANQLAVRDRPRLLDAERGCSNVFVVKGAVQ